MESKLNIEQFSIKKVFYLWLIFLITIFVLYSSTEIIVPGEFVYLDIGQKNNNDKNVSIKDKSDNDDVTNNKKSKILNMNL